MSLLPQADDCRRNETKVDAPSTLEAGLGYRFRQPQLLVEALTHRSALHGAPGVSFERLEFLGDAVLGFVAAEYAYHRFPDRTEGELTALRAALVRAETLAQWAQQIDLGQYLRLGRGVSPEARSRQRILAAAFEALLGAVLLDGGLREVRGLLEPRLATQVVAVADELKDYKSRLQERAQAEVQLAPTYHVVATSGPDHARAFTVAARLGTVELAIGHGASRRSAEQDAARKALDRWPAR